MVSTLASCLRAGNHQVAPTPTARACRSARQTALRQLQRLPAPRPAIGYGVFTISASANGVKVNDAMVITPDVMASNGVIHVVDSIILPPSLAAASSH